MHKKISSRYLTLIGLTSVLPLLAFSGLVGFMGWGLMTGRIADTKVLTGNKLPPRVANLVSASAGLAPGEQILYFYSAAMTPAADGNLLSDQRVLSYVDDGTDAWCESIANGDIATVRFEPSSSWLEDSVIVVTSSEGLEHTLYASTEGGGDVRFVEAIRAAAGEDSE